MAALFEKPPPEANLVDDSLPLFCTFDNYRLVDGHTEYIIKVQRGYDKLKTWTVFKRYKEFVALDKELRASSFDIRLPPKKFIGNLNRPFIIQRQNQLQNYMNKVLDNLILSSSVYVKKFLDPENYSSSFHDTAFEYASMALRGKPDFHNLKTLPYVGWRFKKQYCTVKRRNEAKREYILTWISEYGSTMCLNDKELQSTFKVLLQLEHPFIVPIITGNCYSSGTLIIRSSCVRGSLRDLIYDRSPFDDFITKCRYRNERLLMPSNAVSTISVQVLHALEYLHAKGIPYGNLHSGNIFIEDNVAKISDIENGIFGLWSFHKPYLVENRRIRSVEDVDIYCFGHVLYEMAFGERLSSPYCDIVPAECYNNLRPVLELILSSLPKKKLPTASTILSWNTFNVSPSAVVYAKQPHCKMSSTNKTLFARCKTKVENQLHFEQNELRKIRKISHLQERLETEEKYDVVVPSSREKRKMKKATSQASLGKTSNAEQSFESLSNGGSSATSVSLDSNSVCDKMNGERVEPELDKPSAPANVSTSPAKTSDDRAAFLSSIANFNKGNLKKVKS